MSTRAFIGVILLLVAIVFIPVVVATLTERFGEGLGTMWSVWNDGNIIRLWS